MKRTVLAVGLQKTGKTTFLAAFWDVISSAHIPGALRLERTAGDMEYLNEIRAAWADCKAITRTGPASDKPVSMLLSGPGLPMSTELAWTDMLGEKFERQWTDRVWTRGYKALVQDAVGILLFVHPHRIRESPLIIDGIRAMKRVDPSAAGHVEPKEPAETDSLATQPIGAGAASPAPVQPEPFDSLRVATQVQLVELLQFVDAARAGIAPLRVAVVASAWDLVEKAIPRKVDPESWCASAMPLLAQFLAANDHRFEHMVFGVSAQGDDYVRADNLRKAFARASDRIKVFSSTIDAHDITIPVRWAIGLSIGDEALEKSNAA